MKDMLHLEENFGDRYVPDYFLRCNISCIFATVDLQPCSD